MIPERAQSGQSGSQLGSSLVGRIGAKRNPPRHSARWRVTAEPVIGPRPARTRWPPTRPTGLQANPPDVLTTKPRYTPHCPTGNSRMQAMHQLPVASSCRGRVRHCPIPRRIAVFSSAPPRQGADRDRHERGAGRGGRTTVACAGDGRARSRRERARRVVARTETSRGAGAPTLVPGAFAF